MMKSNFILQNLKTLISIGWKTLKIGALVVSFGGVIEFQLGSMIKEIMLLLQQKWMQKVFMKKNMVS